MEQQEIVEIINQMVDTLYENDSEILTREYDLHERTITHRMAMYLEPKFEERGYKVDVEYNRMREQYVEGEDVSSLIGKRLNWENSGEGSSFVYPDIIVHKRDTCDNLIEIEVKMAWKNRRRRFDYDKINQYMEQLGYQFGIYIELADRREDCLIEFGPFNLEDQVAEEDEIE